VLDTGFFVTIAGLSVSVAGFASLMHSFRGSTDVPVVTGWRIRYIVTGGLTLAVASLGVVVVISAADDVDLQVRLATLLAIATAVPTSWTYRSLSDERVFRTKGERVSWVVGGVLFEVVFISNLFFASETFLLVMWVLMLAAAMSLFVAEVSEMYRLPGNERKEGS
jgi:hypothetical protein